MIKQDYDLNAIKNILSRILLFVVAVTFNYSTSAQAPTISSSVDKKSILIGEHIRYKIEAFVPGDAARLFWINLPDSIEHFEVVERGEIDSTSENGNVRISQVITLTSFDSGRNTIPIFQVGIEPHGSDSTFNLFTDSIPIDVMFSPADSVKTFHDIKPIIEVSDKWPWWMWAALIISGILVILLIMYLVKQWRKRKGNNLFKYKLSPYDEAMLSVDELKKEKLLQNSKYKLYHTRLSGILKTYISRKLNQNVLSLTSSEILLLLKNMNVSSVHTSALAGTLRMGDAVKFAKYYPPDEESETALVQMVTAIAEIEEMPSIKNEPA